MSNMAESVTSASLTTETKFPFVRVPMFELLGSQTRAQTGSEMIAWAPFVTEAQQSEWSTFSTSNLNWYNESIDFTTTALANEGKEFVYNPDSVFLNFIWTQGNATVPIVPRFSPGPFGPIWQISPPPNLLTFVNYDMLYGGLVEPMLSSLILLREGLMTAVLPDVEPLAILLTNEDDHEASHLQYVKDAYNGSTFNHPHSLHLQPVYEKLNDHDSNIVGLLFSLIPWDTFMAHLLPEGVTGIVAVLHNTCGEINTYFLDGYKVLQYKKIMQKFIHICTHISCCLHVNRRNILDLVICTTQLLPIPK
jgi:hypothetical protein